MTRLNGPLTTGGIVRSFRISPDSARVVYRADQQTDEVYELYSVPIAGGPVTKLNGAQTAGGNVDAYFVSPDAARVVYHADQQRDEVYELYLSLIHI